MAESTESTKARRVKASTAGQEPTPERTQASEAAEAAVSEAEGREKTKRSFEIAIFSGWCKGCGICAAFCPRDCIAMGEDGSPVVQDAERCTGCGFCEIHCPDFAISVRARKTASLDVD